MNRKQRQGSAVGALAAPGAAAATVPPPSSSPRAAEALTRVVGIDLHEPSSAPGRIAASRETRQATAEEIRTRAFELYLARGGRDGNAEGDWLQAERELRERAAR